MSYHCVVCNEDFTNLSAGGPSICPSCDCGIPPEVKRLRRENAKLRAELLRLKWRDEDSAGVPHPGDEE